MTIKLFVPLYLIFGGRLFSLWVTWNASVFSLNSVAVNASLDTRVSLFSLSLLPTILLTGTLVLGFWMIVESIDGAVTIGQCHLPIQSRMKPHGRRLYPSWMVQLWESLPPSWRNILLQFKTPVLSLETVIEGANNDKNAMIRVCMRLVGLFY